MHDVHDPGRAALEYAAQGWAVVPVHTVREGRCSCGRAGCASPGKHPHVRWHRYETQSPSVAQITSWWRRWPDANVAVVTGMLSGVVVLDVDPRHGGDGSLESLEQRWGSCGDTVECETGGGGLHRWFASESPLPSAPVAPGCELKAEGGLVVVPPSTHSSGARYRWRAGRAPAEQKLARVPEWLVALVASRSEGHGLTRPAGERTSTERREFADLWAESGVKLRDGDRMYLCPFHDDHHPSLHVDADGCRWHCFGCRRGGGIGALRAAMGTARVPRPWRRLKEPSVGAVAPAMLAGDVDVDVVGESAYQDALLALTGGRRSYGGVDVETVARLGADPEAPLDPDAVVVRIGGRTVGRLRLETAHRYRALLSAAAHERGAAICAARIAGGWDRGRGDVGAFGVRLLLPALDDLPPDEPRRGDDDTAERIDGVGEGDDASGRGEP